MTQANPEPLSHDRTQAPAARDGPARRGRIRDFERDG
jgi:hypothetical protein